MIFIVSISASVNGSNCEAVNGSVRTEVCTPQFCAAEEYPSPQPSSSPTPQLGECERTDLDPVLFIPKVVKTPDVPVLVSFPSEEMMDDFCPLYFQATGVSHYCRVTVKTSQAASHGQPALADGSINATDSPALVLSVSSICTNVTQLSCQLLLPLPYDGQFSVTIGQNNTVVASCGLDVVVPPLIAEVSGLFATAYFAYPLP